MTDDRFTDHEIAADLALREDSQRDRSRSRGDAARGYAWSSPDIVGQWRCRNKQCGAWIPVTSDAMETLAVFNQQLRARAEAPLDHDAILVCDACRVMLAAHFATKRRDQVERMRVAIVELKQTKNAERQRELLDQLRIWHHPDIDGLTAWIRERDKQQTGRRRDL